MKFPDFIIAGFGRAGTSALLLNLGQHPDIQIALANGTEIRFWNNPLPFVEKNLDGYKNRFHGEISGEKTPGYCLRPHIIRTIRRYIPDVKIILCIRNPIDRALSHFELHKRWGRLEKDEVFNSKKHRLVINESLYVRYVKNCILSSISRENVYFHVMEWAKKDLSGSLSKIYKFLGAKPYEAEVKKTTLLKEQHGETHYMKLFKGNSDYQIWSQNYYVNTSDEEREKMYKIFKPYNKELFKLIGYEIKEWEIK